MQPFKIDPTWSDKDSRVDEYRRLYEENDFLTAYSEHTGLRMQIDPKGAIGRADEWESHGLLQLQFLIGQGLKPEHRLLDVGCGPGRAARRLVPYLALGHYCGVDISVPCLQHAIALSLNEGWTDKKPLFLRNSDLDLHEVVRPDYIWAHSVFTHLPPEQIEKMVSNAAQLLRPGGKFYFTYKRGVAPQRTGLKQWRYPFAFFASLAARHGLKASMIGEIWPASQRTGVFEKPL